MTVQSLASFLRKNGIKIVSIAEGDDLQDGEIRIDEKTHVQVGSGYSLVNQWIDEDTLQFSKTLFNRVEVLSALREKGY